MGVILYNIFLWFYRAGIGIASLFDPKAKKWLVGRRRILTRIKAAITPGAPVIWMHCASLGEFEQGRPLLEKIRQQYPGYRILLTFFSPSGYEVQKDYKGADWVFYLPMDGPANARRFLEIVQPVLVIFVKYEFWYYYLKKVKYRNIPLLLVSGIFRPGMFFFKWYGAMMRKMLGRFDHLFVQNEASKQLMEKIGLQGITSVSGDTRFDRVAAIAGQFAPIAVLEQFAAGSSLLVAGSTWVEDEECLQKALARCTHPWKVVIAPHEISPRRIEGIQELFPGAVLFSSAGEMGIPADCRCLVIDNYGMLSKLYRYGHITYVGGGLATGGVHNVLEAAVYNKIVLFGPYYQKYTEAVGLVQSGGGISFTDVMKDGVPLAQWLDTLYLADDDFIKRSNAAGEFVQQHRGATEKILTYIQEKRLLTN